MGRSEAVQHVEMREASKWRRNVVGKESWSVDYDFLKIKEVWEEKDFQGWKPEKKKYFRDSGNQACDVQTEQRKK